MKDHKLTITSEPEEYPIIDMEVYLQHLMVCPICGHIGANCDQKKDIIRDKVRYKFFWEVDRIRYHGKCQQCDGEWDESAIIKPSKKRYKTDILTKISVVSTCLFPVCVIMTYRLEGGGYGYTFLANVQFFGWIGLLFITAIFMIIGMARMFINFFEKMVNDGKW